MGAILNRITMGYSIGFNLISSKPDQKCTANEPGNHVELSSK